jgi:DNA replication protein DnaC
MEPLKKNLEKMSKNGLPEISPNSSRGIETQPRVDPMNSDDADVCPICGGTGVIRYEVPVGHPYFGKLFRCPGNHGDLDAERREKLRQISNMDAYSDKRLDNFNLDIPTLTPLQRRALETTYQVALQFAQHPQGWLMLQGNYGCGKTHLAAAIGNARLEVGDAVLFITVPDLLDYLRSTYGPTSEVGYDEMFDRVKQSSLLILDDLGAENPSPWAREKLFQLLNHRYSRRLPTVITTNVDPDLLDPRIRSRILDDTLTNQQIITAPDYRTPVQDERDQLSNLRLYGHMTFQSFDVRIGLDADQSNRLKQVLRDVKAYADNPRGWLVLTGKFFGCGKTHLAAALAHHQQSIGKPVIFVTAPDLLDYLRLTYGADATSSFDKRFQLVRTAPLLVLDDLGVESPTAWAKEKLFQLIDYRYVAGLPTVITTAKNLSDLDHRLVVRLFDTRLCSVVELNVLDYATRIKRG